MAGGETVSTEGACEPWLPFKDICSVQSIIFTLGGTDHTIGAAVLIDG